MSIYSVSGVTLQHFCDDERIVNVKMLTSLWSFKTKFLHSTLTYYFLSESNFLGTQNNQQCTTGETRPVRKPLLRFYF